MKTHIFTLACIFTLVSGTAFAQEVPASQDQATSETRDMSNKLGLNESEYIRLKALNADRYAREAEINKMYSNDAEMRERKINELLKSYEAQLKAFLNLKQLEAYAAYKTQASDQVALRNENR